MSRTSLRLAGNLASCLLPICIAGIIGCSSASDSKKLTIEPNPVSETATSRSPLFQDITKQTGIDFTYRNGEDDVVLAIIESLGGGVACIDYNGDGLMDLFFPGGGYYQGETVLGHPCKLFQNLGNFQFKDVSKEAGLEEISWQYSHGAAVADYDCDGWPDIVVSGYSRLILLRNELSPTGGRKLVDVTAKAKLNDQLWSASIAWGDLDSDGFPELYVCHYGDWGFKTNHPKDCFYHDAGKRDVCQPRRFNPLPHALYKNNGDGTFTDISKILKPEKGGHGLGVLIVDVNLDRKPDIYVCNDTDDNYLYINRGKPGGLSLTEEGLIAGVARDDKGYTNGSMGVDGASFDRSGRPSIIVTNYENELPALYVNRCTEKKTTFSFGSNSTGLAVIGGNYVSWGTGFLDIENRGWEDLVIVSGHAIRYPLAKFGRLQKPVLMRNDKGSFKIHTPAGGDFFQQMHNARGSCIVDLNNDGKLDLVISHLNAPITILQNISSTPNHWIGFQLVGAKKQNLAGTRIALTCNGETQYRFVKGGGSFASTNDPRLHFGLGTAEKIDRVKIEWPNGKVEEFTDLKIDTYHTLESKE